MDSSQSRFHLQVVTDTIAPRDDMADILTGVLEAGADAVQLRDATATPAQATALAHAIGAKLPDARNRLIVHERLSGPETAGFAWRHVRSTSITGSNTFDIFVGSAFGASVHSRHDAQRAADLGAAYLTFGHVFSTGSHPGAPPRGIAALADVVGCVDVPVLAIGGITLGNLDAVLATGCAGIAVITAVLSQPDPRAATQRLRELLDTSLYRPRYLFPARASSCPKGTP